MSRSSPAHHRTPTPTPRYQQLSLWPAMLQPAISYRQRQPKHTTSVTMPMQSRPSLPKRCNESGKLSSAVKSNRRQPETRTRSSRKSPATNSCATSDASGHTNPTCPTPHRHVFPESDTATPTRFPSLETVHAELSHQHTPPPDPRVTIDQNRLIHALKSLSPTHAAVVEAMEQGKYQPRLILKYITQEHGIAITLDDITACIADMRERKPKE